MVQSEVHLRNYIKIIRKYDFVIAVSFFLVFGSAFVVSLYIPRTYEASNLILIKKSSSGGSPSSANVFQSILSGGIEQEEIETLKRRFITESLLRSTVDRLENLNIKGVKYLPSVRKLKKCISPERVPDTRYIKLSVRLEEEEGGERNAALLANTLVEQIQEVRSREKVSKAKYRKRVLENKLSELENQIVSEEERLHSFMKNSGTPTIWQAKFSKLLDERSELLEKRKQSESGKLSAELELKRLKEVEDSLPKLVDYSETVSDNPIWTEQVNRLRELEFRIAGVKTQAGEDSPELESLLAQKKEREQRLKELDSKKTTSITKQISPIYLSLIDRKIGVEISIERAEEQLKRYEQQIQKVNLELENLIAELPENQFQFSKISRNVRLAYDISKEIQRQMIELELAIAEVAIDEDAYEALEVVESELNDKIRVGQNPVKGGIEVIDKAYPEKIPVSPRINFISAIAGMIGLAVGLTIAFMLEYFDDTYKTPDDIRTELGVDIIGVIPKSKLENTLVDSLEPSVIESYDVLASNVDFIRVNNGKKTIMLTSSIQAENKSNLIANLGISISKANNKVLIVDANLRNGLQHEFFNLPPNPGLIELLKDSQKTIDETVQSTEYSNLYLLPTGLNSVNPIELLSSDNMTKLIKELEENYDLVLFDTTPIFPVADVLVLAPKLNDCILIADLEKISRDTIIRAKERLDKVDVNLLGLICSKEKSPKSDMFYT